MAGHATLRVWVLRVQILTLRETNVQCFALSPTTNYQINISDTTVIIIVVLLFHDITVCVFKNNSQTVKFSWPRVWRNEICVISYLFGKCQSSIWQSNASSDVTISAINAVSSSDTCDWTARTAVTFRWAKNSSELTSAANQANSSVDKVYRIRNDARHQVAT